MKLSDLLTVALGHLRGTKQYGLPLLQLYQSQIAHDPAQVIELKDVDGRGTSIKLKAKGKQVCIATAVKEAVSHLGTTELDVDREGGLRFDFKGLTFTVAWRKRTSAERIADTRDRILTPTGRLSFSHLETVDEKKARHAAKYATGGFLAADLSGLEERAMAHYLGRYVEAGISVAIRDGKLVMDVESFKLKAPPVPVDPYHGLIQPINCRCTVKEAPKRKSIEVLATSLKQPRRESTLPRDMVSGGGLNLKVVGSSYRTPRQQDVLRSKNIGNMVLLAHEPDNDHSKHAIAVFAWANGQENYWHHIGYVQDVLAKGLLDRMRQFGGGNTDRIALKGSFVEDPGLHSNPLIRLDEVWSFADSLRA